MSPILKRGKSDVRFGFKDFHDPKGRNIGLPLIPVLLEKEGFRVGAEAVLDSGADASLFDSTFADALGISIQDGEPVPMVGIGGRDWAYAHVLTLSVSDGVESVSFPCRVLFREYVRQNLLGREDFFEVFRITFARYEGYIQLDQVVDPDLLY
jgi:hypothetical protein